MIAQPIESLLMFERLSDFNYFLQRNLPGDGGVERSSSLDRSSGVTTLTSECT